MKIKCPKCKYEWNTKSKLNYVSCPNCQRKVKREEWKPKKQPNKE